MMREELGFNEESLRSSAALRSRGRVVLPMRRVRAGLAVYLFEPTRGVLISAISTVVVSVRGWRIENDHHQPLMVGAAASRAC